MTAPRLLMVDDNPGVGAFVREVAERLGFDMAFTDGPDAFKSLYRTFEPDLIVLDLVIPDTDGIELLQFLASEGCRAPVLLMSGINPAVLKAAVDLGEARNLNMAGTIPKPVRVPELRSILQAFA